jgi:hypothetical protein
VSARVAILALLALAAPALAAPPAEPVESILCRGTSAEGFSYWWGGECWCEAGCSPDLTGCGPGACTPDSGSTGCPDCTHSGTYGADCSGFVSKAWQVPDPVALDACGADRYVAADFTADHEYWDVVSMSALQPGDAVASASHVILVIGETDAYGENEVVEAKGCSYGIVRHSRTFGAGFSGARRINLTACACAAGDVETQDCGDCGRQQRGCSDGCTWSDWSACDGPDPTGAEAACSLEGAEGECAIGVRACVAGWLSCHAPAATTDVCDGRDNDCDGITDNGTAASLGEGEPCTGACAAGVSACVDGEVVCVVEGAVCVEDSGDGACTCGVGGGARALPLLPALLLLGLLARRRR